MARNVRTSHHAGSLGMLWQIISNTNMTAIHVSAE